MLDNSKIQISCPECNTQFQVRLIQVANEETVTCPGCHKQINLVDKDKTVRKSLKDTDKAIEDLQKSLKDIKIDFRL